MALNLNLPLFNFRQEQALYWLCKAAERGSKEARDQVTDMFHRGYGVNEANFEVVYATSWQGGLSVLQLMGRRLGRKTFRKLELGRGFCSTDQLYRLMKNKDISNLDSEDVRLRCKGSSKVFEPDLAEAGAQHMNGLLPDLDRQLDLYRKFEFTSTLVEISYCSLAIGVIIAMLVYGHQFAILPVALMLTNLIILYNHSKKRQIFHFETWSKIWPKNLLIPGLYESAVTKFFQRRNLNSSLLVTFTVFLMAFFNTGAPFHVVMFTLTLIVIWKDVSFLLITFYLFALSIEINLFQTLHSIMVMHFEIEVNLPPQLMFIDVPSIDCLHILPFGVLAYQTLSKKKPQLLWPLMYLTAYSMTFISISWIVLSTFSMLHLAFTSQIYRLKTISTAFIVSLFLAFVLTDFKGPSIGLSNSTNKAIVDQLSWSDFYDLCIEEPWTMRLEQQMQCNRLVSDVF